MKSPSAAPGLVEMLLSDPQRFDVGTAIRVADAGAETVDITSDASTRLSPTPLSAVERKGGTIRIRSSLPGLVGAFGALPPAYTQMVLEEEKRRSKSLAAFLDIFAEPLLRLLVAAGEKYRLPRLLRWRGLAGANRMAVALFGLTGLRSAELRRRNVVGDDPVLCYAGFFAATVRNASSLAAMLGAHTGLPVSIEQFRPRWVEVPDAERSVMAPGRGPRLGIDAMAGRSVKDHAGGFRIVVGPVGYLDYLSLEPGSPRVTDLMDLTRLYVGPALRFDVQVVLRRDDVPFCRLGDPLRPPKLGWNTWARTVPLLSDSRDAVIAAPG